MVEVRDCVDGIRKFHFEAANKKRDFKPSGSWLPKDKLRGTKNRYLKSL
jgi:hypothetical protein